MVIKSKRRGLVLLKMWMCIDIMQHFDNYDFLKNDWQNEELCRFLLAESNNLQLWNTAMEKKLCLAEQASISFKKMILRPYERERESEFRKWTTTTRH